MRLRQLAVVCLLVGLGAAALTVPSVAIHDSDNGKAEIHEVDGGNAEIVEENASDQQFGTQVSSFAQASAVDVSERVDASLWEISINESSDLATAIENRTAALGKRVDQLKREVTKLEQRRENLSTAEYTARASGLRAQITNVHSRVGEINETASREGVQPGTLDELREKATNMTGPEISELAQNITDVPGNPPAVAESPAHAGPATRGTNAENNRNAEPADNRNAEPGERHTKSAVDTDRGGETAHESSAVENASRNNNPVSDRSDNTTASADNRSETADKRPETAPSRPDHSEVDTSEKESAGKENAPSPERRAIDSPASDRQPRESSGDKHPGDVVNEQQPENAAADQNADSSSGEQHQNGSPDDQQSDNEANDQQEDNAPDDQQSDNAADKQNTD